MNEILKYLFKVNLIVICTAIIGCSGVEDRSYDILSGGLESGTPAPPIEPAVALLDGDGWISKESYYEKTVHYGTSRFDRCQNEFSDNGLNAYTDCLSDWSRLNTGNSRGEKTIKYGRVKVKIPYLKKVGGTSGMSLSGLHHDIGWEDFITQLTADDLLVFIHGYNTSFTNAAIRCAQLAHDTNFKGEAVFYSWPSAENPLTYAKDKKRAQENFKLFAKFLEDIASQTDKKIHIVAHSMGTYILMNSLVILDNRIKQDSNILSARREKHDGKIFSQIILAAPDISKDDYHKKFSMHEFSKMADNFTFYSSENDHVLYESQIVNYFIEGTSQARLGDSSSSFFVIKGMDTVDTRQEISSQFFGHSFYANYRSLVSDMYILLKYGTYPDNRMLQKVIDKNDNTLWFIRD